MCRGVGLAAAIQFASCGGTVLLGCRNKDLGTAAVAHVRDLTRNHDVHLIEMDLSSHASIEAAVAQIPSTGLDVVVHNAGVLLKYESKSVDGLEMTFATNTVGCFALTQALLQRKLLVNHRRRHAYPPVADTRETSTYNVPFMSHPRTLTLTR